MNDTNVVVLKGRLVKGAELKQTGKGTYLATFSIANNETIKTPTGEYTNKANFFDCVLWGPFAKSIHEHLTKGREVNITGRLQQDRWEDNTGKTQSKIAVVIKEINLMRLPAEKLPEQVTETEAMPLEG